MNAAPSWIGEGERAAVARMIDMFGSAASSRAIGVTPQTLARIRDGQPVAQGTAVLVRVRLAEIVTMLGGGPQSPTSTGPRL
jgi:hypothetical protein